MRVPKRSPDLCDVTPNYYGGHDVVLTWGSVRVRIHLVDAMAEHVARQVIRSMKKRRDAVKNDVASLRDEAAS